MSAGLIGRHFLIYDNTCARHIFLCERYTPPAGISAYVKYGNAGDVILIWLKTAGNFLLFPNCRAERPLHTVQIYD